ncbi:MAG: glycosyltransferase family 2 protein [Acidobacteriota bacterium]
MTSKVRPRTARPKTPAQLADAYPLSVVIPARNAALHLPRSLRALASNDLRNVEVWVVDDASHDHTSTLDLTLSNTLPTRILRLERQSGPAAARNAGLARASKTYVFFLDADVVLPKRAVEWIRETLDIYSHRPEVVGVLGVYSEETPGENFFTLYKNLTICYLYQTTETLSPFVHTPIFCIQKDVLQNAGGFDPGLATTEDFRLAIELGRVGFRFVIDRRIRAIHLKQYTFQGILREDSRRIRDLRRIRITPEKRRFYYRAHRWRRLLSVALPVPSVTLAGLSPFVPSFSALALACLCGFYALNLSFLLFCFRRRGLFFSLKTALFLFVEMLWAELVVIRTWPRQGRP